MTGSSAVEWVRSSRCNDRDNCVECARSAVAGVLVRDSKAGSISILSFRSAAWAAFIGRCAAGPKIDSGREKIEI